MTSRFSQLQPFLLRRDVRLAAFGIAALLAVYLGFIGLSVRSAEDLIKRRGYYLMLATFALWGWSLFRLRGMRWFEVPLTNGQKGITAAAIVLLSLIAINAEPYQSKILNDEFVLQSTAFNMHYFRDVATMVRGYDIQGVFLSTDNYLDKRPYFYPFVVSLLHDLTGYRVANAFIVNSLLLPAALALAFVFGRLLHGWRGGLLAVLLLGSLPLLGQNATGSGMELLNVVMILAALVLATAYLQQPDEGRLSAFLLTIVLLAQTRYESALYVVPAALVIASGWWRQRRIELPWITALVPLLLLPVALQNKVVSHSPVLWELAAQGVSTRFDFSYFPRNFRGAVDFLFHRTSEQANSLTLSVLGVLALAWAIWAVGRALWWRKDVGPARMALFCFSVAVLANTLLVFCYYWSRFNDPMASRFALPLHLLMAFTIVLLVARLDRALPASRVLLVFVGVVTVAAGAGKMGYHYYSHLGVADVEWQRRYVNALPPGDRLVVTNESTLPWLLQKTPSILVGRARMVADRLQYQLSEPIFREILIMQTLRPTSVHGDFQIITEDQLPPSFKLEVLAEKRFGARISRINRLTAIEGPGTPRPSAAPAAGARTGSADE